ncbi:unnamed protein product, partial [Urochloa humidicola]
CRGALPRQAPSLPPPPPPTSPSASAPPPSTPRSPATPLPPTSGCAPQTPLGAPLIVGLDCEWKPDDHSWSTSKVAILQLCTGTRCLILQLLYVDRVPASVKSLLADPGVRFVGVGVGEDAAKLAAHYGLACAAAVDVEGLCNDLLGRCAGWASRASRGRCWASSWRSHAT